MQQLNHRPEPFGDVAATPQRRSIAGPAQRFVLEPGRVIRHRALQVPRRIPAQSSRPAGNRMMEANERVPIEQDPAVIMRQLVHVVEQPLDPLAGFRQRTAPDPLTRHPRRLRPSPCRMGTLPGRSSTAPCTPRPCRRDANRVAHSAGSGRRHPRVACSRSRLASLPSLPHCLFLLVLDQARNRAAAFGPYRDVVDIQFDVAMLLMRREVVDGPLERHPHRLARLERPLDALRLRIAQRDRCRAAAVATAADDQRQTGDPPPGGGCCWLPYWPANPDTPCGLWAPKFVPLNPAWPPGVPRYAFCIFW